MRLLPFSLRSPRSLREPLRSCNLQGAGCPPRRRAFTLVELMVVMLILAILAALVIPRLIGRTEQAKVSGAKTDVETFAAALQMFRLDNGRYPSTEEGLESLRTAPSDLQGKWRGPYIEKDIHPDPWGNAYHYTYPASGGKDTFEVMSYGADGQPGGTGDDEDIIGGSG